MTSYMNPVDMLNTDQRAAYDAVLNGRHVFITGPGGTGKSFLMNVLYNSLHSQRGKILALTALTGCAAYLLHKKAKTLHSWAGVGLAKDSLPILIAGIRKSRRAALRWIQTDILVIDEVSMLTPELFETLDKIGRKIRRNEHQPFGGIQLVLVGDFYQLPPIVKTDISGETPNTKFLFESELWKSINFEHHELKEIVRQKDPSFQEILNEARRGELSKKSIRILSKRIGLDFSNEPIKPTMLFTRRAEVDDINMSHLRKLTTERRTYKASTLFQPIHNTEGLKENDPLVQKAIAKLDIDSSYNSELTLAIGAQVMLIVNMDPENGLVNGSRGVVIGYGAPISNEDNSTSDTSLFVPIVQFKNGMKIPVEHRVWEVPDFPGVLRRQIPLRLAYAITIHKCVSEDTLLSIPGKGLIKIKELENTNQENNTIYCPDNLKVSGICETKDIIEVYKGNIEDGIKFTTTFGYEITTSNRHPLLTFNKDTFTFEWKKAPIITKEDYIVIKKGAKVEGEYLSLKNIAFTKPYNKIINVPEYINEDFGYLLGVMLGDGSINDKTYRFDLVGIDIDILDRCVNILKETFNITVEDKQCKDKTKTKRIFFYSKQLVEIFRYIGYNFEKADKKIIPDCILALPISVQKAVIQGLYDTDGGVSNSCINYTTTSEIMGKQIQQMLFNMNIPVSRVMMRDKVIEKNWRAVYRINISGKSALKFVNDIGFKCERKIKVSHDRFYEKETLRKNNNSQSFEVPNGNKLIENLRNEMRNGVKRIKSDKITTNGNKILSSIIGNKQKLRCDSLNVIINEIDNISQYPTGALLSFIYNNGILIDTVKSIENISNIQMYDIGVSPLNTSGFLPDGHDFIANGFVNHNCQGSTLDCALIDVGGSIFEYGQAYVALSRIKDLESLYIHDLEATAFRAHPKVKSFYSSKIE